MTITITFATELGRRASQEDRYVGFPIDGKECRAWLLAVFDGHLGPAAADLCEKALFRMSFPSEFSEPERFLRDTVAYLDEETRSCHAGTTASVCLIVRNQDGNETAWIAVLGDSPVFVLDRAGHLHVGPDHNIRSNEVEREAAVARGGVVCGGYLCPPRSDFGLQMSRVLGDSWFLDGILSREPEVISVSNPVWVLVASDGVFDDTYGNAFSPEAVRKLAERNTTADDVFAWVNKGYHFRDNATAVVWSVGRRFPEA